MSELFRLEKEEFSEAYQEQQGTYLCLFEFTFTDHGQKKPGREVITKELILDILKKELNGRKRMRPQKIYSNREVFVREYVPYQDKNYLLVFGFENNNSDWLGVRNCYLMD